MQQKILLISLILVVLLIFSLLLFRERKGIQLPSNNVPMFITDFKQPIANKEKAKEFLNTWIHGEYTTKEIESSKIEKIDEYSDYFILQLTEALRPPKDTHIGFRDYKLTKDGKLYGFYYPK